MTSLIAWHSALARWCVFVVIGLSLIGSMRLLRLNVVFSSELMRLLFGTVLELTAQKVSFEYSDGSRHADTAGLQLYHTSTSRVCWCTMHYRLLVFGFIDGSNNVYIMYIIVFGVVLLGPGICNRVAVDRNLLGLDLLTCH